jgi:hypothetical protein
VKAKKYWRHKSDTIGDGVIVERGINGATYGGVGTVGTGMDW